MAQHLPEYECRIGITRLYAWRRRVVRWWIGTMITAIAAWALAAAMALPKVMELALGVALFAIALAAIIETRRGRCPDCGARIRFEPRIELPRRCASCGSDFAAGTPTVK